MIVPNSRLEAVERRKFRLDLLGPFGLFTPEGERIEISSRKCIAMLGLLALGPSARRSREFLRGMLWETRGEKQAQDSLRRELSNLRIVLRKHDAEDLLTADMQRIGLAEGLLDIDLMHLGLGTDPGACARSGEFLEGLRMPSAGRFGAWLEGERTRVAQLMAAECDRGLAPPPTPREIYGGAVPDARETLKATDPSLPPKPSIAVLPFTGPSDADKQWLGPAVADSLEKLFSQFPQLFLASGSSTRRLVADGMTVEEISARLGVRFLVEGSVVEAGGTMRVTVGLVDGPRGEKLWADSIDGESADIWQMVDQIAERIAPRIWSIIDTAERKRGLRQLQRPQGSYQRYWRANALLRSWEEPAMLEAVQLADSISAEHPACALAAAMAAYCHSVIYAMDYGDDPQGACKRASQYCQEAIRLGSDNVEALGFTAGAIINIGGNLENADRLVTRALHVLPSFQPTLFWGGWLDLFRGDIERGEERLSLALRINPVSGARAQTLCGLGLAALARGEAKRALRFFEDCELEFPEFLINQAGKLLAKAMASGHPANSGPDRASEEELRRARAIFNLFRDPAHRAQFEAVLGDSLVREPQVTENA